MRAACVRLEVGKQMARGHHEATSPRLDTGIRRSTINLAIRYKLGCQPGFRRDSRAARRLRRSRIICAGSLPARGPYPVSGSRSRPCPCPAPSAPASPRRAWPSKRASRRAFRLAGGDLAAALAHPGAPQSRKLSSGRRASQSVPRPPEAPPGDRGTHPLTCRRVSQHDVSVNVLPSLAAPPSLPGLNLADAFAHVATPSAENYFVLRCGSGSDLPLI